MLNMLKLNRLGKEVFQMNNNSKEPYQHYKRPQKPRVETYSSVSKGWIALIILIIVVLISLVPVVHHLAANNNSHEKVVEVRKTSKKAHTKTKAKVAPVKNKEIKAKAKPKPKSSKKTPTKPKKKRVTIKQYVVQDGDSLTSIAQHFNISVGHLAELNQLDPNSQVDTGQTLRIR